MPFPVSPGVTTNEVDLTTSIPAVAVSTGAFAGQFNWGPVNFITPISSEVQLVSTFSEPDNNTAESFFTVANFLSYSNDVKVARAQGTGMLNAAGGGQGIEIDNPEQYFNNQYNTVLAANNFVARYPGVLGDSLEVVVFANTSAFATTKANTLDPLYTFANYFSWAPNTTPYLTTVSNGSVQGDELHAIVVDRNGQFTGTANSVLEVYQGLSKLSDALDPFGNSNYYKEVIWKKSKYVYVVGVPSANVVGWGNTTNSVLGQGTNAFGTDQSANVALMVNGNNGIVVAANVEVALDLFADPAFVDISLLMTGTSNTVVQNYAIQEIAQVRKDCVAFVSAPLSADQDTVSPADAVAAWAANVAFGSYGVADSGYKYQYDKYNDKFRWIPLNGDVAGLCARTDQIKAPWWSPAGLQRGVINNVVKLAFNPGQVDRDTLYQAGVNPVVSLPGQGTLLYGDKTHLNFSSAFDRINVRRLFIVLEKQISLAARTSLFEFNDTFTRAQFVSLITPYLRTVQGQRGITAFKVVCDTTNNTPDIIDADQFVGDIYIQPARSINYILLNFVAVATGVSFSEVVGQF
jgi:hypothetical protein